MRPTLRIRAGYFRLRQVLAALAVLGLGSAGLAAVAAAPASAATSCQVAYSANSWSTGFTASITITNEGSALTSWTLAYSYSGNQQLTQGWSGNWSQSGENVTVTNASWNGSLATGASTQIGANFSYSGTNTAPTAFTINGTACTGSGSPSPSPSPSSTGSPTSTPTPTPTTTASPSPSPTSTGSCGSGLSLLAGPGTFSVAQGTSEVFGVSLSAAPASSVTVTVANTSGNSGLSVSAGSSIALTSSNWNLPQPVTVAANSSGTGAATFTVSAPGCTSVTVTGTETAAGSTTTPSHVANPFTGSSWYVNPNYTSEVATSVAGASGTLAAQMTLVGQQPTGVWLDRIAAIYGGSLNSSRMSLQAHLQAALSQESGSTPILVPLVIYDLPNRDCAALASNGELTVSNNGLQYYEQDYINPIAQILTDYSRTNIRVVAVIEPDSLPNLVTNLADANCAQANSSGAYVSGVQYALNKLHAIPNVYNYIDIAHSAWLGWPSNMGPAVSLLHTVAAGTTAGVSSVDGFISNTANYTPTTEPFMTATESVGGNPVDSVQYYSYDPYIDELTYDEAMYSNLVSAGFSSNIGMLIDTSRNGWGGPNRPTAAGTSTVTATFVNQSKIDQRPFRGDWCNQNNAGLGAFPQANPNSSFTHLYAYVWIKPPGESDGDYPSGTHTHGDPHCDPSGTNTDGSGNTYSTNSIPGYDIAAGQWFPAEFQMLVQNAYPAVP
ncbi:MAG TPA: glycoside hydrolase family 6 protein [Streptosporangiaceae bacterium]|nr:glycoside hydrolase family 6 protein [Streptosporangiaceae bacterium]